MNRLGPSAAGAGAAVGLGQPVPAVAAGWSDGPAAGFFRLAPCCFYLFVEIVRPMTWFLALAGARLGLIAAAWGLLAVLWFKDRPLPKPIWWTLAFVLLMAVHVPLAVNNRWALWGFQEFATMVFGVLPLAVLPRSVKDVHRLAWVYLLLHIPAAYHAIRYAGRGVGGWMGDENDLALAMIVAIGIGVYLALEAKTLKRRILAVAMIVYMLSAVVSSLSRGGMVGLAAVVAYLIVVGPYRRAVIVMVVVGAIAVMLVAPPIFWEEVESISGAAEKGDTGENRLYYWRIATDMFLDYPLIGVGTNNYRIRAQEYQDPNRVGWKVHMWGRSAHSLFFTLLPEHGLVGIGIYTPILVWMLSVARRFRRMGLAPEAPDLARTIAFLVCALTTGQVGFLACGLFLSVLYYPPFWLLLGLLAALDAAATAAAPGAGSAVAIRGRETRSPVAVASSAVSGSR